MKKLMMIALAACAAVITGCIAVEVKDYGYEVVRDADGKPLVDNNGVVQTVHKGQRWHYNKNMAEQTLDDLSFTRKPGDAITLNLKNYQDQVSPELNKLVAPYERIAKIQLIATEFEKTPKRSIKRYLYSN